MHQRKSKKIIIYLFLLIIVGSINNIELSKVKLNKIKNINIFGLDEINTKNLLKEIKNINLENIFFLNAKELTRVLDSNALIEEYKVFKKYPSTINVRIKKTKFYAKIKKNGYEFLIGSNGKFLKNNNSNLVLPYIFGNPEINEFLDFKKIIDHSNIKYNQIQNLYFFKSKRWDIELKSNILIKLSKDNTSNTIESVYQLIRNENFNKFKTIDARVENQIVLND